MSFLSMGSGESLNFSLCLFLPFFPSDWRRLAFCSCLALLVFIIAYKDLICDLTSIDMLQRHLECLDKQSSELRLSLEDCTFFGNIPTLSVLGIKTSLAAPARGRSDNDPFE